MSESQDARQAINREADLAQQLRLYEAVLSTTPDLAYVFDLHHRFIYANEGLLKMWGKSSTEAIGKTCAELGYEPWHAEMHDREIQQVVATKKPIRGEVPFSGTLGRRIYDYILTPVFNMTGEIEAVAGTTRDVTEIRAAQEQLRHRSNQLETLIGQAPLGIFLIDSDFHIIQANAVALDAFPETSGTIVGRRLDDIMQKIWSKEHANEMDQIFRHTLSSGEPFSTREQPVLRAHNHTPEYYEWRIDRIRLPNGSHGIVCYFREISDQVRTRQAQQLLINELNHRVKNTLAVVQSLASQTFKSTPDPKAFQAAFSERLTALSNAHNLLTQTNWDFTDLEEIVRGALAPYEKVLHDRRISIDGPRARISPASTVSLTLAFHELVVNAIQHGSLSVPDGHLAITWSLSGKAAENAAIDLTWREDGGPAAERPTRRGFGTRLLQATAEQVHGTVDLQYGQTGFICKLHVPSA